MRDRTLEPPALGIAAAYFFLFLLVFWPVADFLTTALPFQWGRVEWRYGAVGLMASYLITPIMGIAFAMLLAYVLQHRAFLRFLSIVCFLGAVFLLLAMVSLTLDILQLWRVNPPEGIPSLRVGGLIAGLKHLSGFIVVILFGLAGWKGSRRPPEGSSADRSVVRPPGPGLKSEKGRVD